MKIDYEKLDKNFWFEDAEGNEVEKDNPKACIYRRCFPLELHDEIYEYCYSPKNPIIKYLCRKSRRFYKWISKGKDKTFKNIGAFTTTYHCGQNCIVAMVNSGDFTLEQAIWVYTHACERCMNALEYKYLDGKEGYEEYSEEWQKCNTVCDFCRNEQEG